MTTSIDIGSIKALIGAAKLDDAIKLTIQKGHTEKNKVLERYGILFSGRLNDLSKNVIAGTVSFDEMNRAKNDISAKMMDLVARYEKGTLSELEQTEEYKRLPTPEEIGRGQGDAEYYKFLQSLKRFWWLYAFVAICMLFWTIKACEFKEDFDTRRAENRDFGRAVEENMKETTNTFPSSDCKILSGAYGMDIDLDAKSLGMPTTIGKTANNSWVQVEEICVKKNFGGTHYFFKVKVPNSDKYGWVSNKNVGLMDRKGECFPQLKSE
jgi:Effector-associated domain 11